MSNRELTVNETRWAASFKLARIKFLFRFFPKFTPLRSIFTTVKITGSVILIGGKR